MKTAPKALYEVLDMMVEALTEDNPENLQLCEGIATFNDGVRIRISLELLPDGDEA